MIRLTQQGPDAVITSLVPMGPENRDRYKAALEGSRYSGNPQAPAFVSLQLALTIAKRLKASGFKLDIAPALQLTMTSLLKQEEEEKKLARERSDQLKRNLEEVGLRLFPFQEKGIEFLSSRRYALLSDQPGCGKTCQAATALPYGAPVLIICPAVAKGVWSRELARWRPDYKVTVLSGKSAFDRWPNPGEAIVVNFDILNALGSALPRTVLIVDEAHFCKTTGTHRRECVEWLIRQLEIAPNTKVWFLTGTPLENHPAELFNVLTLGRMEKEVFGGWNNFVRLFKGYKTKFGYVWGKTPDPSVPERLKRVMLRRLRKDVLPELPDKTIEDLEVDADEDYLAELDKIAFKLQGEGVEISPLAIYEATRSSRVVFETVSRLRTIVAQAKIPAALKLVESFEEEEEPLVVASAHQAPLEPFRKRPGWAVIDGSTKASDRTAIEEAFQAGKLKGVAGSIRACGTAITLTRAARMVFVDESWNPAENEQMSDRIHRIGQTRGTIITRLFVSHALDKHVLRTLGRKEHLTRHALGDVKEEIP